MTTAVNYAGTPLVGTAELSAGDTSRTSPTTFASLIVPTGGTGGTANAPNGAQIERITITPLATCTGTTIRFWWYDGTNYHLKFELPLNASTITLSVPVGSQYYEAVDNPSMFPQILPAGWSIRCSMNDTQSGGVNVFVEGGGF